MYVLLALDCGPLNATANGLVSTSSGTTFMTTATYTCNTGYNIVGSESRTCGASGVWSGQPPVCNCKINVNCMTIILWFDHSLPIQWFLWAMDQWMSLPTTLSYHWQPLDPLPSPVTLSYPPAAEERTTTAMLSEGGEDQMVTAFLTRTLMDSTCHEVWAPLVWTMLRDPVK